MHNYRNSLSHHISNKQHFQNLLTNSSDDDFRAMIKDLKEGNYMVPPAPKPVNPSLLGGRMVFPPIEVS